MENQNQEIVPANGTLEVIPTGVGIALDPQRAITEANKRVAFYREIKTISLKMTNENDWVMEAGKPYLQGSGCEKLKPIWGIEIKDARMEPSLKEGFDLFRQNGEVAFECMVTGKSKVTGEESVFIGGRSSRDGFFSNQKSLDIVDVYKAAYTNAEVQAVMRLLGMRNLTPEDLESAGINLGKVSGVAFKGEMKEKAWTEATGEKAKKIGQWLIEMSDGDRELAAGELEKMTVFTGKDGRQVAGKRSIRELSEKQVEILYGKAQRAYEDFLRSREEA